MQQLIDNAFPELPAFDPRRSALIAIHWQNDVVGEGAFGSIFAERVASLGIVPRVAASIEAARKIGMTIIFVNVAHTPGHKELVPNNALFRTALARGGFVRGTRGVQVIDALKPAPGDFVIEHSRISAFYGTDLDIILRSQRIDTVFLSGVATNVAVDHTARDAAQQGYNTALLEDCCCSSDQKMHDASLLTLRVMCTAVISAAEFQQRLARTPAAAA
jgi:nicotinamidase-related amidase